MKSKRLILAFVFCGILTNLFAQYNTVQYTCELTQKNPGDGKLIGVTNNYLINVRYYIGSNQIELFSIGGGSVLKESQILKEDSTFQGINNPVCYNGYLYSIDSLFARNCNTWDSYKCVKKDIEVGLIDKEEVYLTLYPNPVANYVLVPLSTNKDVLELYNSVGTKQVLNITEQNGELNIDTSALEQGLYLLNVNGRVYRFLKE